MKWLLDWIERWQDNRWWKHRQAEWARENRRYEREVKWLLFREKESKQ